MRLLKKNAQELWIAHYIGEIEELDEDGYFTGNMVKSYSIPEKIYLNLYPYDGTIGTEIFGENFKCDMITISIGNPFLVTDIFFKNKPIDNSNIYDKYDYSIIRSNTSLNQTVYALKKRL